MGSTTNIIIITRAGYGNAVRFVLRFSFSPCFRAYFCASHQIWVREYVRMHCKKILSPRYLLFYESA